MGKVLFDRFTLRAEKRAELFYLKTKSSCRTHIHYIAIFKVLKVYQGRKTIKQGMHMIHFCTTHHNIFRDFLGFKNLLDSSTENLNHRFLITNRIFRKV